MFNMAESRDQTLIDFQRAVNSIMEFGPTDASGFASDGIGPSRGGLDASDFTNIDPTNTAMEGVGLNVRPPDHGASEMASGPSYSTTPLNFTCRMIHFNVEYRDRNVHVVLPDNETVGRIKEVLEVELSIPKDKQNLKGLVKRKVDDSTLLRELYLPRENSLYLLTPEITNPTVNKTHNHEGEGTSQGLEDEKEYTLKVSFHEGSKYRNFDMRFDCSKTVGDVKQSLQVLTDVPARHQVWSGWPRSVHDQEKLYACGLNYPTHEFNVSKARSTPTTSKAADEEELDVDNESDEDFVALENNSLEDDLFSQDDNFPSRAPQPLMPDDVSDEKDALEYFSREFTNRYGECHPHFFIGSLDAAIQESLSVKATDRKLLALYLHHDKSIFSNVFCSQLLCADVIVNYLSIHFITWAWDLTLSSNTARLLQSATRHFGSLAANQMRNYSPDQLPSLLLISRSKATNEVIDAIQGHIALDEMMTRLIHAVEVFQEQKQADVSEEKEREAREQIKQEQDEAYQESLAADRKKAEVQRVEEDKRREEMEKEMEIQKKEEDKKKEVELIKEAISQSIANTVPDEPPANCVDKVSSLRFRAPKGEVFVRRFCADNTIRDVLNFLTAKGFHTEDYKVLTTFPRRDVTSLDFTLTLESCKLYPQETLILEER